MDCLHIDLLGSRKSALCGVVVLCSLALPTMHAAELNAPPVAPNDEFFILGSPPEIPDDWTLSIDGAVERPQTLTLDDVKAFPALTEMSTLECYYTVGPLLLVSNATWTGVRLNTILQAVGPLPEAKSISFHALDGYIAILMDYWLTPCQP